MGGRGVPLSRITRKEAYMPVYNIGHTEHPELYVETWGAFRFQPTLHTYNT